jgi:hypothetical protein
VRHGLLDALNLLRGIDLGLKPCLMGCGGLGMCAIRFPQKIRSGLCSFSKGLHLQTSKKAIKPCGAEQPKAINPKGSTRALTDNTRPIVRDASLNSSTSRRSAKTSTSHGVPT